MKKTLDWMWRFLAAFVAAPPLISALQREFQLGLAPAYSRLVGFYREVVLAFAASLHLRELPPLNSLSDDGWARLVEAFPLSALVAGIVARSLLASQSEFQRERTLDEDSIPESAGEAKVESALTTALSIIVSLALFGGLIVLAMEYTLWPPHVIVAASFAAFLLWRTARVVLDPHKLSTLEAKWLWVTTGLTLFAICLFYLANLVSLSLV